MSVENKERYRAKVDAIIAVARENATQTGIPFDGAMRATMLNYIARALVRVEEVAEISSETAKNIASAIGHAADELRQHEQRLASIERRLARIEAVLRLPSDEERN